MATLVQAAPWADQKSRTELNPWGSSTWTVTRTVDEATLQRATARIVGERSFGSFAKSGQPERGTRCRIERAEWERWLAANTQELERPLEEVQRGSSKDA